MKRLHKLIKKYDTIIIHRHNRPDGDALGTQAGLCQSLKLTYPKKKIYMVGDVNPRLDFICKMDDIADDVYKDALVIIVDVAVSYMISDLRYKLAKEVFIVDHHTNKSDIVDDEHIYVDSSAAAAAQVIAEFLYKYKYKIDKVAATALYTGICTDSGRFQYSANDYRPMLVASKLIKDGADALNLYDKLYVETLESKRQKAEFTTRMCLTEKNVAYVFNTLDDLKKYNMDFNTCSRGMVNTMSGIEGINIWANFTQEPESGKVVCEFRSRGLSIVDIAKKYGGGGHDQACGATILDFEVAKQVLKDFDIRMEEFLNGTNPK